jgi:hypothetical protein
VTSTSEPRTFRATAKVEANGRIIIAIPFDPAEAWGPRDRYHVSYTIDGRPGRSTFQRRNKVALLVLGPKSGHRPWISDGDEVDVSLQPEGPQTGALAADIVNALHADPAARRAFDSLATFYRKGWLTWIDSTKRRPEVRVERIAQMVELIKQGHKERPR